MADYQLTSTSMVIRAVDGAFVPSNAPENPDCARYQQWLAEGGVPDPYIEPEPPAPQADPKTAVLYDHDNRIRALEGQSPQSFADFIARHGV